MRDSTARRSAALKRICQGLSVGFWGLEATEGLLGIYGLGINKTFYVYIGCLDI